MIVPPRPMNWEQILPQEPIDAPLPSRAIGSEVSALRLEIASLRGQVAELSALLADRKAMSDQPYVCGDL